MLKIKSLILKSYEDMTKGLLAEERFATLTVSLETEQRQLKAAIPEMEASLDATTDKSADLQRFIERARQVTRLTELMPESVHEFIEKIVVSKPDKVNSKRHQRVDIHYNTIGLWCAPPPEEMEKLFQEHLAGQRKKRHSRSYAVPIDRNSLQVSRKAETSLRSVGLRQTFTIFCGKGCLSSRCGSATAGRGSGSVRRPAHPYDWRSHGFLRPSEGRD